MRRWKKIALALVCLLIISQVPFAYRRYRLGRLRAAIDSVNASRAAPDAADAYAEYKGVFHVHSALGGHSRGTFEEIVSAARAGSLDFVVMTEHPSRHVDTSEATLRGTRDGVLFINGSELAASNGERIFVVPGMPDPSARDAQTLVARAKAEDKLAFIAYPEEIRDWSALRGFDGIEVYNLFTDSKNASFALLFFDGLWSYRSHADLLFTKFFDRPDANLRRWDELNAAGARLTALAGNDAHSNVGLEFGDRTGEPFFQIKLDPYERSFAVVRTHVLIERTRPLERDSLLEALRLGRTYIAFDLFADPTGFRFEAETASGKKIMMGEEITLASEGATKLRVKTPVGCRVKLFRDGEVIREEAVANGLELAVEQSGVYRVEVYLDTLREFIGERPWIISNPIYVR